MATVIHIFGASGSGTTTLGRALSQALHLRHMDADDYFWLPTDPPFTHKRPIEDRLALMRQDMAEGAVVSGSLAGWGDGLMPHFTLAVRVTADTALRLERLRAREYARFGSRILPGGDMCQAHQVFLDWAASYDDGPMTQRSRCNHDEWQRRLTCPLLAVDGAQPVDALVQQVLRALPKSECSPEQYARTAALLGEEAMARIHRARIAVFGVGGVGGYVCEALVRSGIQHIDLFDNDDVSVTNINRQIIALHATVGQDKVTAMANRLQDICPAVEVGGQRMFYLPENADAVDLTRYDFVVDAVDTVAAKVELAVRCDALGVPLIAAMGAGNKLDPSKLRIADIYKTDTCPLARAMRATLRKKGVKKLTVAYSTEEPVRPATAIDGGGSSGRRKDIPGSTAFVPSAMGLLMASHIIRTLAGI